MADVVVVGGGLAGCAAALALAEHGAAVTLIEKRAELGGRAASFRPRGWAEEVDNSQHVLLRCCTNLLDLYRRLGVADQLDWHDEIALLAPSGESGSFRACALPAPLHLAPALTGIPGLSGRERLALAGGFGRMLAVGRGYRRLGETTFASWLGTTPPRLTAGFWRLMLTSVLNAGGDRIAASAGLMFFLEGLMRHRQAFHLGVPRRSLSAMHHTAMLARLTATGVDVRLRGSARIEPDPLRVLAGDQSLRPAAVVCAVPWDQLPSTAPALAGTIAPAAARLEAESIVGVHFRFAEAVDLPPVLGLLGHEVDWVFRLDNGRRLSLVVSDARDWAGLSTEAIAERAWAALRGICPRLPEPRQHAACRETRATFVPAPGSDRWRPAAETSVPGLWLAGEWTATGWPSTMESAVRSGYAAAERISGRPTVVADLPRQGLMRLCLAR